MHTAAATRAVSDPGRVVRISGRRYRHHERIRRPEDRAASVVRLTDRYGVRWQIVPTALGEMITDPDQVKAGRVAEEMLKQVKFDIASLEAAFQGR